MTGRERATLAARGGQVDRKPLLCALGADPATADIIAVPTDRLAETMGAHSDCVVLAEVLSPLGRAVRSGTPLVNALQADLSSGMEMLSGLARQTREEIRAALDRGADGVFYVLEGAFPAVTTPMEYGGHFLELDRQLLSEVQEARFNVLFVCGVAEPYIDFVSDLPAHAFAWDPRSGVSTSYVRSLRTGALASSDDDSDFQLLIGAREEAKA